MLCSHHKCATAIHFFCDPTFLSPIFRKLYHNPYLKKLLVKPVLIYGQTKKHLLAFTVFNKTVQKLKYWTKLQNIIVLP